MGCSAKAISEDAEELEWAIEKTGMSRRGIQLYSTEADAVIKAAREGLTMEQTIGKVHEAVALRDAAAKTREELAERKELDRLLAKYGTPKR